MGKGAAGLAIILGGAIILGLANSGSFPWLAQIIGGALAVAVFVLVLAKIGGDGEE